MRKIRKLLSLICAFAMLAALIPTSLAVTVGAETVTETFDLSNAGNSAILGPISFWYAKASDYGNPSNISPSIVSAPDKLYLLDTVTDSGDGNKYYRNSRADDTYRHFCKNVNNEYVMYQCTTDITNVVLFTAPRDGTYSYYLATYSWGDQGTVVDINANGQWKDMLQYGTDSANCPSTQGTVELKAGQKIYFIFRIAMGTVTFGGNTIKNFYVKADYSSTDYKAGDVFSFNAAQLAFNVSSPYSLEYYNKDFGVYPSDTASHQSLPVIKDDGLNPGGKFNFYTDAEDSKTHISVNAAQNKAYFYASSRTENHIITFTAPVCGEYTYNLKGKITETGRDWSLCASFCKGGKWFEIKRLYL